MSKNINNFDELFRKIESLSKTETSVIELLDNGFLNKNTRYSTVEEFLSSNGLAGMDLTSPDIDKLDNAVRSSSDFASWDELLLKASEEFTVRRMKKMGIDIRKV